MLDTCSEKLAARSLRQTDTRLVLLDILHKATGPLAPPEIVSLCHKAGRKANKTTVYRDLATMEASGIVRKVIVSDRKQYFELTERGHHHHLICMACERIQDIDLEEGVVLKRAAEISQKVGFAISSHAVEFYGHCASCLAVTA
ncbi:MAG: Fur family transcriptional regulator [Candidatus Moraniibacteriota bacterium]|nr:MAG: transcriptional repressor [Candidatus Moranbacteria bacterium]